MKYWKGSTVEMNKPIIGITMGDSFGNGPEISVKALSDETLYERCNPLIVGDAASMEYAAKVAKKVSGTDLKIHCIDSVKDAKFEYGTIDVLSLGIIKPEDIPCDPEDPKPFGLGATPLGGEGAFSYVVKDIELAMAGEVDATVIDELQTLVRELIPVDEIHISTAGCTISSHCGPKCLGVLFINE